MKEMMFKKLTALEDELTVIRKEQKIVENSRAGKKPDAVRVLEKKARRSLPGDRVDVEGGGRDTVKCINRYHEARPRGC